ncbi:hypothetical protein [Streptomyces sp. HNM1019]|uniref:hypothetical protein n=1 Tax=Streptomyces sp. HNM1019 TaxID=3424717 RepID=UPI003D772B60
MTGLGRYFLAEPSDPAAVRDVLHHLVTLTEPVRDPDHGGRGRLPGWFSPPSPQALSGPGREWLPDQETAIRRLAHWLMSWRQDDENTRAVVARRGLRRTGTGRRTARVAAPIG